MFDFLKSKGVPDVGKEKEFDEEEWRSKNKKKHKLTSSDEYHDEVTDVEESCEDSDMDNSGEQEEGEEYPAPRPGADRGNTNLSKKKVSHRSSASLSKNDSNYVSESNNLEIEKINAKLEASNARIGQLSERFSYLSESIGEIRTMNLENEKKISNATKNAEKVIDIVKEVKPEQLRIDYQKVDIKVNSLEEKIGANKQFMDSLLDEIKDLKRNSEVFIGTQGLIKLNEDTKKDLIEVQRISSKTKINADKSQEIFMEIKKGFAESQKVNAIINDLSESYSDLKDRLEKINLRYGKIVSQDDFADFKKSINTQLSDFKIAMSGLKDLKRENSKIAEVAETALSVSKRNEEDIGEISLKIGDEKTKKVSDFENEISSILKIMDELTDQMSEVRKKLGYKGKNLKTKNIIKAEKQEPYNLKSKKEDSDVEEEILDEQNKSSMSVDEALSKLEENTKSKNTNAENDKKNTQTKFQPKNTANSKKNNYSENVTKNR